MASKKSVKKTTKKTVSYAPEVIFVEDDADEVRCDGGGGALGHPTVYYTIARQDYAECGYCDRLFIKKKAKGQMKAIIASLSE